MARGNIDGSETKKGSTGSQVPATLNKGGDVRKAADVNIPAFLAGAKKAGLPATAELNVGDKALRAWHIPSTHAPDGRQRTGIEVIGNDDV